MTERESDFGESAPARAARDVRSLLTSIPGVVLLAIVGAGGAFVGSIRAPDSWNTAAAGFLGFVSFVAVFVMGSWVIAYVAAFPRQRNEARIRLQQIKEAAGTFELSPTEATTVPGDSHDLLRVLVENRGSGGRFGVVIEEIDGVEEPLVDPFAPLHWMARPGVLDEEIPTGEGRLIGVGFIENRGDTYTFRPRSPDGTPYGRDYQLHKGRTTIWLRVSSRGLAEITYVKWISVSIEWDGAPGSEYSVSLGPEHDPPEARYVVSKMARLLDY